MPLKILEIKIFRLNNKNVNFDYRILIYLTNKQFVDVYKFKKGSFYSNKYFIDVSCLYSKKDIIKYIKRI